MTSTNERLALPVGTSDFEALRANNQIYVDKTALIYELARRDGKFFLTRPRRFGRSLLVSTFASLFKEGLKYFSGLAIEKLWKDTTYNVVKVNFYEIKHFTDIRDFARRLDATLATSFSHAGFRRDAASSLSLMAQLSLWLKTQPCHSLVLLVDEYDAPQTVCLDDKALFDAVRRKLSDFYTLIKSNDACWRFVFVASMTKLYQTSIFGSDFDNFTDISLDPLFAPLLGYTEEEIDQYFSEHIKEAAKALNLTTEEVRRELRENYGGFCFDEKASEHLYAPKAVLQFFSSPANGFENYWMRSSKLSILQRHLHSPSLKILECYAVEQSIFTDELAGSSDFDSLNDLVLLTQAGYLTIKRRDAEAFYLGYPDKEVAETLGTLYRRILLRQRTLAAVGASNLEEAVCKGNVDLLFDQANHAFAAVDYSQYPIANEGHCQTCLQLFLSGFGFSITAQRHGALGRSDLEVETPKLNWVFELKYQRKGESAEALLAKAVEQVKEKQYGTSAQKPLIRAAAVFSEEKRQFVCWQRID